MSSTTAQTLERRERRWSACDPSHLSMQVRCVDHRGNEKTLKVEPSDLSQHGACLITEDLLEQEQTLTLLIQAPALGIDLTSLACVRWLDSKPTEEKRRWIIGCEFLQPLPDDVLTRLAATGQLNRRSETRYPVSLFALASHQLSEEGATGIRIEDYSAGGVRFYSPRRINLDERLLIKLPAGDGQYVSFTTRPLWQLDIASGHFVGCSFTNRQGFDAMRKYVQDQNSCNTVSRRRQQAGPWIWLGLGVAGCWALLRCTI